MSQNYNIRKACPRDLEQLVIIFDGYRQFYKQPSDVEGAKKHLTGQLARETTVIFVAESAGNIVGFTQLFQSYSSVKMKPIWILNDLFVELKTRKAGIAQALLNHATVFALKHGAAIKLETESTNIAAQNLYKKCGWINTNRFLTYWYECGS